MKHRWLSIVNDASQAIIDSVILLSFSVGQVSLCLLDDTYGSRIVLALFFLKFDDLSDPNIFFAVFAKITPQVYKFYTKRRIYYLIASFFYREFLIFDWVRAK